jgi:hypothetical protein
VWQAAARITALFSERLSALGDYFVEHIRQLRRQENNRKTAPTQPCAGSGPET